MSDELQSGFRLGDWEVYPQENLLTCHPSADGEHQCNLHFCFCSGEHDLPGHDSGWGHSYQLKFLALGSAGRYTIILQMNNGTSAAMYVDAN